MKSAQGTLSAQLQWSDRANCLREPAIQGQNTTLAPSSMQTVTQCTTNSGHCMASDVRTQQAISKSRRMIRHAMLEQGIPGGVVAVSVDGRVVWSEGLGYSDVENQVACSPESVMRIASISKPLTAVALLQMSQEGKVDLDASVREYVPNFPLKRYDGHPVAITTRQLLSHMTGIRHYHKKGISSLQAPTDQCLDLVININNSIVTVIQV